MMVVIVLELMVLEFMVLEVMVLEMMAMELMVMMVMDEVMVVGLIGVVKYHNICSLI